MQPPLPHDSAHAAGTAEAPPRIRWFARNRRDGARLISSALVITVIALVAWSHPAGKLVALAAGLTSLYWWRHYRQLQQ